MRRSAMSETNWFERLAAPFPEGAVKWLPVTVSDKGEGGPRALAAAYLDARAVMDRLDEVCGPANWSDAYVPGPAGGVLCRLSIRLEGEWVTKEDVAENTEVEPVKGGVSDALRRAAVKWGVGRYLYRVPQLWVPCELRGGRFARFVKPPALPAWALPSGGHGGRAPQPASGTLPADPETGEVEPQMSGEDQMTERARAKACWDAMASLMQSQRPALRAPDVAPLLGGAFNLAAVESYLSQRPGAHPVEVAEKLIAEAAHLRGRARDTADVR